MQKNKTKLCAAIVLAAMLAGCSQPVEIPSGGTVTSSAADPMQQTSSENETEQPEIIEDIRYGYGFVKENIVIENGKLSLTPSIMGEVAPTSLGILVFVDGMPMKYTDRDSAVSAFLSAYDTIPDARKVITLDIDAALDGSFNEHWVTVCALLCPNFYPDDDHPWFGNYHGASGMQLDLPTDGLNNVSEENPNVTSVENAILSDEQKMWLGKFCSGDGNVDAEDSRYNAFILKQNGNDLDNGRYRLPDNNSSLTFTFDACSSEPQIVDYRVSFFKNHIPCKFNGDQDFLDFTMEGRKITETEITIDDIKVGDIIYCIAVPLGGKPNSQLLKSNSGLVIGENDKLFPGDNGASR